MLKKCILGAVLFALSGCGAAYISPDVSDPGDGSVQVVMLTPQSVSTANSSKYRPKQIPDVFFQNAGAGGAIRSAGATPEPVFEAQTKPAAIETRLPPAAPEVPYTIGVGDVILLATKSSASAVAELSGLLAAQNRRQGYTVQDDGSIAIPDVGRVRIGGLKLEDAEAVLFQALVENQIDPSFSLEIAQFNSQRVSVGGAVARPGIVTITLTGLQLDDALLGAGGVSTQDVDYAVIRLYRDGNLYQIPLSEHLRRPDLQDLRLVAGDSIFVDTEFELTKAEAFFEQQITLTELRQRARAQAIDELQTEITLRRAALNEARSNFEDRIQLDSVERDYVYLTGEVNSPGRFTLPFGRNASLADALFSEGGFNAQTGDPSQIYVLRASSNNTVVTAWHLDTQNVVNLVVATQMEMRPNDIVFIAEQPITRWNRVVQQIVPSLITSGVAAAVR